MSNNFIFVKSETTNDKATKNPIWVSKPFEKTSYEPTYDEEKEWVSKDMKDQIMSTVSSLETKPLKDKDKIYIVLGVESQHTPKENSSKIREQVFYPHVLTVLDGLSAEVLSYLNPEHTKLLISCRICDLTHLLNRRKYRTKYFEAVKRISPLLMEEQISENLKEDKEWATIPKDVFIELIPNLPNEKKTVYARTIVDYLKEADKETRSCCDEEFVVTKLNQNSIKNLLGNCNFIFRVNEIPRGILQDVSSVKKVKRSLKNQSIKGKASSIQPKISKNDSLPIVCVLDSGVNYIPELKGLFITPQDGFRKFSSFDDDFREHGHGTPIAYLTIFGENSSVPKARVISYKIYSDQNGRIFPESYKLAFAKYSSEHQQNQSRIFVSSIVFEKYNDGITANIDKWIQENNICAVFSSGNIDPDTVIDYALRRIPCSSYFTNHPVQDPAQAVNAVAVGAIAKRHAPNSISQENELSPFTRCGIVNGCLYDCQKPEFVENGGNYCKDGTALGLTSYNKKGERFDDFVGTSFSAPLFANRLAEIYAKCGTKIKNAETLKAIAMALSCGELKKCRGFGETKSIDSFNYDLQTLVCSEGTVPLPDTLSEEHYRTDHTARIKVIIPNLVNSIKMFLVHSDNHYRDAIPHLNTYLKVKVMKIPSDYGKPELQNPNETNRKCNMKVFEWAYPSHSMGGIWEFIITPEVTTDMLDEHKRATTIRYGCAILVNSKTNTRPKPLTEEMYDLNKQYRSNV